MRKIHLLDSDQQQFAAENHNIVERFLSYKRLDMDEFYDVVIFGYLLAVQEYLEKPELNTYSFSTIAWRNMNDCVASEYIYRNRPKRSAPTSPLEEEYLSIDTMLPNRMQKMAETLDNQKQLVKLLSYITPKEQEVVRLKADGYTYREIAQQCSISIHGVGSRFSRMRQRLRSMALI
ncbi:sigma-70 family RNA polymerase sigma factor [Lachnospiraceae bacterium 42-17]